ncbi:MAG: amidohydrolase, partial [Gemmatimonadota bacterium]
MRLPIRGLALFALLLSLPAVAAAQEPDLDPDRGLPLEPDRWARFTTTEGTWISLDVSPDGETIAFDLLGDLYSMPVGGGEATRLTSGMGYDMQPRFSPDGENIVFVSDRSGDNNVWWMPASGGEPRQLSKGVGSRFASPIWTPDGQYVMVSRAAPGRGLEKIWMYHIDGGTGLEVVSGTAGQRFMGPALGPDGRYLWYAERSGMWSYNAIMPQYQLRVYDRETGTRTPMTNRYGSAFRPELSPNGEWLAYGSRDDEDTGLVLRNLDSGEEHWLAYPIQRDDQESTATMDVLPGYDWMPDGSAIVMSYGGGIWSVPVDGSAPTEIPFSVDAEIGIGPEVEFEYPIEDTPTFVVKQIRDTESSPDGSRVVFTALDRLYVSDIGGTPEKLTNDDTTGEYQPVWSPDGRSIAYVTWDDDTGEGHIRRVSADGGNSTTLTTMSGYYQQIAWSPDGNRIVAMRSATRNVADAIDPFIGNGLDAEFVWVPANGGDFTVIGPVGGRRLPHFTQDGDRIYYYGVTQPDPLPGSFATPPPTLALSSAR